MDSLTIQFSVESHSFDDCDASRGQRGGPLSPVPGASYAAGRSAPPRPLPSATASARAACPPMDCAHAAQPRGAPRQPAGAGGYRRRGPLPPPGCATEAFGSFRRLTPARPHRPPRGPSGREPPGTPGPEAGGRGRGASAPGAAAALYYQVLNFAMIVSSALMIWKGLIVITGSESPIVVVLRENGNIKFLTKGDNNEVDDRGLYKEGQNWLEKKDVVGRARGFLPYVGMVTIIMNDYPKFKYALLAVMGAYVLLKRES
ncbi:signal peptidase complex catalytic subunit SEC11C isoform X2 [Falco cherrug]|uniref:signal peptidase complex catalytic subunit SEC11C isoform X2 n=1 Tax=Falco cherrug TaxID=345164 RepID=UPI00247ABE5D|nr:signal peptidase complex catalytic subunit SEC11C isoform X2 [Falco cherrug]